MEQRRREIGVAHLHGIIETPEGGRERVADSWEAAAGGGVCFEHKEGLAHRLRNGRGIEIRGDDILR